MSDITKLSYDEVATVATVSNLIDLIAKIPMVVGEDLVPSMLELLDNCTVLERAEDENLATFLEAVKTYIKSATWTD
jgi:hypothetical protein